MLECSVVTPLLEAEGYLAAHFLFTLSPLPRRKHRVQTVEQWGAYSGVELRTVLCVPAIGGHGFQAMRVPLTHPLQFLPSPSVQCPFYCNFSCTYTKSIPRKKRQDSGENGLNCCWK